MSRFRNLLALCCLASSALCAADPSHGAATVLPEVKKHLEAAHKYLEDGSWQFAKAHADLILISDNVSLSVDFDQIPASQRQTCQNALAAACHVWEAALDNTIHFHFESNPSKAALKVTFKQDVRMGRDAVAGFTKWTRNIRIAGTEVKDVSFEAAISVRSRGLDFRPFSFECVRQATEHELGHVLGLDDSNHVGDLMGELDLGHPVSSPRQYEVAAVKSLREEAKLLRTEADARSAEKSAAQVAAPSVSGR